MASSWYLFLFLALMCVAVEGFFSMMEMASVSFHKVRLLYYSSKKNKRALWLKFLLDRPSRLFGTTLIIVNTVLQIGSEAARRFYESLHMSPDWAPITQTLIVVILGELAPLFAARRHSEQVALFGSPILYFFSRVLSPIIWFLDLISRRINQMLGKEKTANVFLSKEEIKRAFEERKGSKSDKSHVDVIVDHIFSLKNKKASELMRPLDEAHLVSSPSIVGEVIDLLSWDFVDFIPIYHRSFQNIIGIAYPTDLIKAEGQDRITSFSRSPWFVTEDDFILNLLKQFRFNNQRIAVVLNKNGKAEGFITLDRIVNEIFGPKVEFSVSEEKVLRSKAMVERTLSGDMTLEEFNSEFHAHLTHEDAVTISDLITSAVQHPPSEGEVVYVDQFEFIVKEQTLMGVKTVIVKTVT